MSSEYRKPYLIAEGDTDPVHGPVQRTKERTGGKSSHVDWWLYEDAEPWKEFRIIEAYLYHAEADGDKKHSICLPDADEFIDADDGKFDEEIAYYERFHTDCGLVYGELNQIL